MMKLILTTWKFKKITLSHKRSVKMYGKILYPIVTILHRLFLSGNEDTVDIFDER